MRLLLDSHIPPALAVALQQAGVDAVALRDWREGDCLNAPDEEILHVAGLDGRVFVTYDCQTVPLLLTELAETGGHHAGVVLVDEKTFRAADIGTLFRNLYNLNSQSGDDHWLDRAVFLRAR